MEKIRSLLPDEVSRHIVKCFDIFENERYYGYILEPMRKMTNLETSVLYYGIGEIDPTRGKGARSKWNPNTGQRELDPGKSPKGWNPKVDPKKVDPSIPWGSENDLAFNNYGPWNASDQRKKDKAKGAVGSEKAESFIDALVYLFEQYNIKFNDLHSANVMIRPSTGDYVATDIGLFDISQPQKA